MDKSNEISFKSVGGLQDHIQILKEMIIYPLLYRELFDSFGIKAPRGVLFYGPPGTGKTLMAGAIASECSKCLKNVSFYMRKGGECLNKYVGESEKHLQNLFKKAYHTRPSIIFFDELDGLVPPRSETQEQVHGSVVATLLALMDGLDAKSEVFVIGATNRIDMIDPALRRPGRFDRELYFPLPAVESRLQIFKIHTKNWSNKPSEELLLKLAAECSGYCGADIQSLCSETVMTSFRRMFPIVSDITRRYPVSVRGLHVKENDFWEAKGRIIPSIQRIYAASSTPLRVELKPLLSNTLEEILKQLRVVCPFCFLYQHDMQISKMKSLSCPRFLMLGKVGQAHTSHIAPAVLHHFDHLPVVVTDLTTITEDRSSASYSSSLLNKFEEVRQNMPSIIYLKNITSWWNLINDNARQVLMSSLEGLDTSNDCKVFIFGTASVYSYDYLPAQIKQIFPKKKSFEVKEPTAEDKKNFFRKVIVEKNVLPVREASCDSNKCNGVNNVNNVNNVKNNSSTEVKSNDTGRLRSGKPFRQDIDESKQPPQKRVRFGISYDPTDVMGTNAYKVTDIKVDAQKLEKLTDAAVKATSKASVSSMIRLYEELEIISLRYASKSDRTSLVNDLEREISNFIPS